MTSIAAGRPGINRTSLGIGCGVGAGALWGLVFLAPELARAFTPLQLAIGRYLAYGAFAAILIAPRWRMLVASLARRDWVWLAWLALVGNTLYFVLLSAAVQKSGIAMASLVVGFVPVAVTIIGSRDRGAVPFRRLLPSLALCAAGALCIGWQALAVPAPAPARTQLIGLLCAIGALVSWSAFAVGNSRCLARLDRISTQDWNLLTGLVSGAQALLLVPVALLAGSLDHDASAWLRFASVSIGVALFASILGNALWNRMSRLLPLTMTGQMILFEAMFALGYALAWEQRLPTPYEATALVLVVASVLSCVAAHRVHDRA